MTTAEKAQKIVDEYLGNPPKIGYFGADGKKAEGKDEQDYSD